MLLAFVLISHLAVSSGLTVYNFDNTPGVFCQGDLQLSAQSRQLGSLFTAFGKNYSSSQFGLGNPCPVTTPTSAFSNLSTIWALPPGFQEWYGCNRNLVQRQAQDLGYVAVIGVSTTDWRAGSTYSPNPYEGGIPVLFTSLTAAQSSMTIGAYIQQGLTCSFQFTIALYTQNPKIANATVFLDFPVISTTGISFNTYNGTLFCIQWVGFSFSLLVMLFAVFKFTQLYTLEGRLRLSVPQITVFFCFLTGLFCMVTSFNMVLSNPTNSFLSPATTWFQQWPFATIYTALIILGFYLREVSVLTTSSQGAVLDKMKIPAAVVIGLLWIMVILASGLGLGVCSGEVCQTDVRLSQFAFSIFVIVSTATFAFLLWGSVSILLSIDRSSKNFWSILFIVILSLTSCVMNIILGIMYEVLWWIFAFDDITTVSLFVNSTPFSYQALMPAFQIFGPTIGATLVLLIFRVTVAKEIELSKSATSSTSNASSKASSSSSSASENIVEL